MLFTVLFSRNHSMFQLCRNCSNLSGMIVGTQSEKAARGGMGEHKLWVSLSALGEGNVFAVLPQIMKRMISNDIPDNTIGEFVDVILPSNYEWQTKVYYKLVEKQRLIQEITEDVAMLDPLIRDDKLKLHDWYTIPKPKLITCKSHLEKSAADTKKTTRGLTPITWTVGDIAKAGCLLSVPPETVSFEDEQEMRRVYTLIYDVFRYKNVLTEALNNISFFQIFPNLTSSAPHIWLLLYDLYHRQFKKRETNVAILANKLFDAYGLSYAENALWTQRIKLAAAVARLRIKHNALSLGELLPPHLKDERVTEKAKNNPLTCWVNSHKVTDIQNLCKEIEITFDLKLASDVKHLERDSYCYDKHCPQIIAFHSSMRSKLAKSDFVRYHRLIVQDKSFCIGAATFYRLIDDLELAGSVIQTHVNSPRTTAYLASLLGHNDKIKKLIAFSAGKRKLEYESYFNELGMANIIIFSERLIDTPTDAQYMEEVVAVFATPPNSYSAVLDPIDLVCSRGGDLSMLEVLTESGESKDARDRVASVLEEQKKTLRFSMSRPQIQFVVYETHSELDVENSLMITKTMKEMNRIATLQHAALQGRVVNPIEEESLESTEINNNEKSMKSDEVPDALFKTESGESLEPTSSEEKLINNIEVPDTDIFDTPELPMLCPSEKCNNFKNEGCYLAVLQRKQIVKLDDKYMIQMAENRGLFGSTTSTVTKYSKSQRAIKKKQEKNDTAQRPKKKIKEAEIDRIAAPTHTFLGHIRSVQGVEYCQKYEREEKSKGTNSYYKKWWRQTTRHILNLKRNLIKQKIIPANQYKLTTTKAVVETFRNNIYRVDEVAKAKNSNTRIPVFPKLRLDRNVMVHKIQIPLTVTSVEFPLRQTAVQCRL